MAPAPPALFSARRVAETAANGGAGQGHDTNLAPKPDPNIDRNMGKYADRNRRWDLAPSLPVANLAAELLSNRNLLAALAGPAFGLTMDCDGGARPVALSGEDLTRALVNLVKNAAEAMPGGGRIHIGLREIGQTEIVVPDRSARESGAACLALTIEDNGPGIPEEALQKIFTSGYTTRGNGQDAEGRRNDGWPINHRGLGLAIARSIVETAGGRIWAKNREQGGARFEIELPVRETQASSS
jgi:signal transduction histidine kinase